MWKKFALFLIIILFCGCHQKIEIKNEKSTLNISYIYKDINEDIINVSLNSEIKVDKTIHKIKTFKNMRES